MVGDGIDAAGNEVLTYIDGSIVHPRACPDDGVARAGTLLRDLHTATAGFRPGIEEHLLRRKRATQRGGSRHGRCFYPPLGAGITQGSTPYEPHQPNIKIIVSAT